MKNFLVSVVFLLPFFAQAKTEEVALPENTTNVVKIYSQVLKYKIPSIFLNDAAVRQQDDSQFLLVMVPRGETVERWTQMITLTGFAGGIKKKLANNELLVNSIGSGFQKACPNSFNYKLMSHSPKMSAVVFSCGDFSGHSETTLIIGMDGREDVYSIQWAERGKKSSTPLNIDQGKWQTRLQLLDPTLISTVSP